MKKIFFGLAAGVITILSVHAQNNQMNASAVKFATLQALMPVNGSLSVGNKNLIKVKALNDFSKTFSNVTNEDWYVIENGFMAKFIERGIQYRIIYNKRGGRIATFRYYNEAQLPAEVRRLVKSTWYDCVITQVTEVSFAGKTAYLVDVEDNTSIKTIKVVNNDMEVFKEIAK